MFTKLASHHFDFSTSQVASPSAPVVQFASGCVYSAYKAAEKLRSHFGKWAPDLRETWWESRFLVLIFRGKVKPLTTFCSFCTSSKKSESCGILNSIGHGNLGQLSVLVRSHSIQLELSVCNWIGILQFFNCILFQLLTSVILYNYSSHWSMVGMPTDPCLFAPYGHRQPGRQPHFTMCVSHVA
jgi:hypothetical protein